MSTQINLTIGDQRLLQANKTRTAANQQALDDRTATKQLEQKATEAAETAAPQEQPGAVPDTRIGRRPAAQRRAEGLYYGLASAVSDIYNLENPFYGTYTDAADEVYSEVWAMPYFYIQTYTPRVYTTRTYNYTNTFTTITRTFKAGSYTLYGPQNYESFSQSPAFYDTEEISANNFATTTAGWYYKYRTTLADTGSPRLTGNPPLPPVTQFLRHSGFPVKLASVSVSGQYIYHSMYYMVTEYNFNNRPYESSPSPPIRLAGMAPQYWEQQNLFTTWSSSTGPYKSLPWGNIKIYGIYRRTDIATNEADTRTEIIYDVPVPAGTTGQPSNDYTIYTGLLLDRMYTDDPRYIAYKQSGDVNTAVNLNSNYTYNPTTGIRLIKRLLGTTLEIYSNNVGKGLPYNEIPVLPDEWWTNSTFVKIASETDETIVADTAVVPYQYIPQ